jgi:hypothetical protein
LINEVSLYSLMRHIQTAYVIRKYPSKMSFNLPMKDAISYSGYVVTNV